MSGSVIPIKPVLVRDPRLELGNERVYGVLRGGRNISWQQFPANSASNSSIQIVTNPPSRRHVLNRKVYLSVTFSLAFSGGAGSAPILQNGFDGPRAYVLSNVITSQTVTFANSSVSSGNFNQYWPALLRYHNDVESQELNYSSTPTMPDFFQQLGDWQNVGSTTTFGYGGAQRNPLAPAGDNCTQVTRAGFSGLTVLTNTTSSGSGNAATATLTVIEPVFQSPLTFARGDVESGFTGIENMTLSFTLGDLSRVWTHGIANSGAQPFNTPTVSVTSATALFEYIEPPETQNIPDAISYPLYTITPNITPPSAPLAYGDTIQLSNLSMQLNGVPRRLYVFCAKLDSTRSYLDSDVYARMTQLTIQFDSNNFVSTATEKDLYEMSRKNGLNYSFSAWQKYVGSVFCCEFGTDIGCSPLQCPGTSGSHQLQVTGTFQDINQNDVGGQTTQYTLYCIPIFEGVVNSIRGTVIQEPNVLSNADSLNAQPQQGVTYKRSETTFGGDFFSGLKNFFGKAANVVGNIAKGVQSVLPIASLVPQLRPFVAPAEGITNTVRGLTGVGAYSGGARDRMRSALRMSGVSRRLVGRGFEDEEDEADSYAQQYSQQYEPEMGGQRYETEMGSQEHGYGSEADYAQEPCSPSDDPVEDYINGRR